MSNPVYSRDQLLAKVLDVLKREGRRLTTTDVAHAAGVEYWAVESVLESAFRERRVDFVAGAGWAIATAEASGPAKDERQAGLEV